MFYHDITKITLFCSRKKIGPAPRYGTAKMHYLWAKKTVFAMKTINVVAALIVRDGRIFATRRGYGDWKGFWEFPGGKVEAGESPEDALVREIREELATEVGVERYVTTIEWDYPAFHLSMRCYLCSLVSGTLTLLEHEAAAWLDRAHLHDVQWLPADETIITQIEDLLSSGPSSDRW